MKQAYISTHLADAQSAGARFHLNPIILLAQAALESGWGTSRLAREANNHFGITGYGASNAFWHGGPCHRPIQAGRAAVPPLRLGTQLLPRLRPPPRLLLPAGRRHEPFPRRLRQGHRLQPLHQRAERRQPGALPGDAGTALPRDRTDLLIPKKQQLI